MKKIELTPDQYRLLIELAYFGEWVMRKVEADEEDECEDLLQHLYSYSKDFGCEDLFEYDSRKNYYYFDEAHEISLDIKIDELESKILFELLISEFVTRELLEMEESGNPPENVAVEFLDLYEKYMEEFENYGLERLVIKEK